MQHAVDYQRGPRTCPTCRERLVSRSPFRSPFGAFDGTVEESAVFRGPPGPARGRRTEEGTDRGGAGAAEGSGGPQGGRGAGGAGVNDELVGSGPDDKRVVALVLGAAGGFVQALCAQINARAIQAIVVAISSVPVGKGGVVDEEWAVTMQCHPRMGVTQRKASGDRRAGGQAERGERQRGLAFPSPAGWGRVHHGPTDAVRRGDRGLRRLQGQEGTC